MMTDKKDIVCIISNGKKSLLDKCREDYAVSKSIALVVNEFILGGST